MDSKIKELTRWMKEQGVDLTLITSRPTSCI